MWIRVGHPNCARGSLWEGGGSHHGGSRGTWGLWPSTCQQSSFQPYSAFSLWDHHIFTEHFSATLAEASSSAPSGPRSPCSQYTLKASVANLYPSSDPWEKLMPPRSHLQPGMDKSQLARCRKRVPPPSPTGACPVHLTMSVTGSPVSSPCCISPSYHQCFLGAA